MFTPSALLTRAVAAEARYKDLAVQFPPGTISRARNEARDEMEAAQQCAAWMEKNGFEQLNHVGPFSSDVFSRGQRVRIIQGSRVFSTDPSVPKEGALLARARVVTIHSIDKGYCLAPGGVQQGVIHWSGAGSYWRWTDINNVRAI